MDEITSASKKELSKNIQKALRAIIDEEKSLADAARCYGVSKATLRDRLKLPDPYMEKKNGSQPNITPDEEGMFVSLILKRYEMGFQVTDDFMKHTIRDALDHCSKTNTFDKCNVPSMGWIDMFLRRQPDLSSLRAALLKNRSNSVSWSEKEIVVQWFENFRKFIESQGLGTSRFLTKQNGLRIFVTCETKVMMESGILHQSFSNDYDISNSDKSKPLITVMTTVNLNGTFAKPFFVFPGTRPLKEFSDVDNTTFDVARSKNGDMSNETFVDWLLTFIEMIDSWKIPKPVILFIDGHSHYICITAYEIAREASVIIKLLPSSVKPLNPVLESLNEAYEESYQSVSKQGANHLKNNFPNLFMSAFKSCPNKKKHVALGFQQTGLVPFDPIKVKETPEKLPKIPPSTLNLNNATPSPSKSNFNSTASNNDKAAIKATKLTLLKQNAKPRNNPPPPISPTIEVSPPSKKSKAQLVGEIRDFAYLHGFKDAISLIVEKFVAEPVLSIYEEALHSKNDDEDIKDNIFQIWKCLNERLKEKTNILYNKRKEDREKINNLSEDVQNNCFDNSFSGVTAAQTNKKPNKRKSMEPVKIQHKKVKAESSGDANFCQKCKKRTGKASEWIGCDNCESWYHKVCIGISTKLPTEQVKNMEWRCQECE